MTIPAEGTDRNVCWLHKDVDKELDRLRAEIGKLRTSQNFYQQTNEEQRQHIQARDGEIRRLRGQLVQAWLELGKRDDAPEGLWNQDAVALLAQAHHLLTAKDAANRFRPRPTWDELSDGEREHELDHARWWLEAAELAGLTNRGNPTSPADGAIRVGSLSPTQPAELGAWLRALPEGTVLSSRTGVAFQRGTGFTTHWLDNGARSEEVPFPALLMAGSDVPMSIEEPEDRTLGDLVDLSLEAPFTVLPVGTAPAEKTA